MMLALILILAQAGIQVGSQRWTFNLGPTQACRPVTQIAPDTLRIYGSLDFRIKALVTGMLQIGFPCGSQDCNRDGSIPAGFGSCAICSSCTGTPNLVLTTPDPMHDFEVLNDTRGGYAVLQGPWPAKYAEQTWTITNGVLSLQP
jgi:hypothetical protein